MFLPLISQPDADGDRLISEFRFLVYGLVQHAAILLRQECYGGQGGRWYPQAGGLRHLGRLYQGLMREKTAGRLHRPLQGWISLHEAVNV